MSTATSDEVERLRAALDAERRERAQLLVENGRLLGERSATGEVLRIIAGGPADPREVLDAIAVRAAELVRTRTSSVAVVEGDRLARTKPLKSARGDY